MGVIIVLDVFLSWGPVRSKYGLGCSLKTGNQVAPCSSSLVEVEYAKFAIMLAVEAMSRKGEEGVNFVVGINEHQA